MRIKNMNENFIAVSTKCQKLHSNDSESSIEKYSSQKWHTGRVGGSNIVPKKKDTVSARIKKRLKFASNAYSKHVPILKKDCLKTGRIEKALLSQTGSTLRFFLSPLAYSLTHIYKEKRIKRKG